MLRLPVTAVLAALALAAPARAADPPDPLRFVPASAQVVVKVEQPRKLAEAVTTLDAFREAQKLTAVRDVLDSTQARRLLQILAYFERELGAKWPELLDQVAGGGVALATTYADGNPALLVIQGTDEAQVTRAYALLFQVIEAELAREGVKERPARETYKGVECVRVGEELHTARVGAAILVSNKREGLRAGLDLGGSGSAKRGVLGKPSVAAARTILPKNPLAWAWLDFASVRQTQEGKDFFASTRQDFLQTLVLGSTIDCLSRSDFVAAGLYAEPTGFRLAVRLPAGRDGHPPEMALHVPPKGTAGSLPLLEPAGVVYSQSFYLDIGYLWKNRATMMNEETRKGFEEAEAQLSKVLPGSVKLGEVLETWSPYHRVVVLNQDVLPYKTVPGQRLPAFAYVTPVKDPRFARGMQSILRSAGLVGSLQLNLKLKTETHDGVTITGYRFPEDKPFAEDPDNLRFNFEPCFCEVDGQFVFASSFEAARKLIPEVRRTAKLAGSPAVWRGQAYAEGAAGLLTTVAEPLITEAILRDGVGLDEARRQVEELAAAVRKLGTVRVEIDQTDTEYRLDVIWETRK